jgi:glycosyltransferase involved in cell wall biosynthesis
VRNFHKLPGAALKIVADLKPDRLQEINNLFRDVVTTKYESIFKQVDTIVIATPVHTHYRLAKAALMSAMACGRCVVVSDIDQNFETIGEAGLSFRSNDPDSLRNLLAQLLNSPERIQSLGLKARERIEATYTWDVVVDRLEQLYFGLS